MATRSKSSTTSSVASDFNPVRLWDGVVRRGRDLGPVLSGAVQAKIVLCRVDVGLASLVVRGLSYSCFWSDIPSQLLVCEGAWMLRDGDEE